MRVGCQKIAAAPRTTSRSRLCRLHCDQAGIWWSGTRLTRCACL